MRAKKNFVVVAYDISDNRRRRKIVKILEKLGVRINFSVFECMLTDSQYEKLRDEIGRKIKPKEDMVAYYPICVDCYTKIVYQPDIRQRYDKVFVV